MRRLTLALLLAVPLMASEEIPKPRLWQASVAALAASSAFDYATSVGGRSERNRLVRNADGGFSSGKGAALKAGYVGGLALGQWLIVRKYPKTARWFAVLNFGVSARFAQVGVNNLKVR